MRMRKRKRRKRIRIRITAAKILVGVGTNFLAKIRRKKMVQIYNNRTHYRTSTHLLMLQLGYKITLKS